jgi:hypothetical protein
MGWKLLPERSKHPKYQYPGVVQLLTVSGTPRDATHARKRALCQAKKILKEAGVQE